MTQQQAVLDYMQNRGPITTYEAFIELGVTRLAVHIHELKKKGYNIVGKDISVPTRYGRKSIITEYSLAN